MKSSFTLTRFVIFGLIFASAAMSSAHAMKVEVGADYPVAIGVAGQGFGSNLGADAQLYLDPVLDARVNNFIGVSYASFTLKADGKTSYRVIPVLLGLELPGKFSDEFRTTFAAALGSSMTYLAVTNPGSTNINAYFTAQVKAGLEYDLAKDFSIYARAPITFLIGATSMSYVAYSIGLGYKL